MDKLKLLLDQIKIKDQEHFESGKLEKIVCNKAKDKYVFCLELPKPLPLQEYKELNKKLKERFQNVKSVKTKIKTNKLEIEKLKEYYKHYMENYSKEAPLLKMFLNVQINLDEENLLISLTNKAEEMKFNSIKETLEKDLNNSGFNVNIITKIDEEKAQELMEEIEKEKKIIPAIKEKKESPFIMGKEITCGLGCRYCKIFQGQYELGKIDTPITKTENYIALASLGSFIKGWTLIIPKEHIYCMKDKYNDLEFISFSNEIVKRIKGVYSKDCIISSMITIT